MKIVADTNIWYTLSKDKELYQKVKDLPIAPNYVSIVEINTSINVIDKEELARGACRLQFHFQTYAIFEPPLIYLAQLAEYKDYDYKEIESVIKFSELFAQGESIKVDEKENFKAYIDKIDKDLQKAADLINKEAKRIEATILNPKKYREIVSIHRIYNFLDLLVKKSTNEIANLSDFDFQKVELITKVLDCYFKTLETTKMKMQPNDWYDFSIMAYVQPGDKFWTQDKRWIRMINESKCSEYLFSPGK